MQFDWTTFVLELLNFLVLLWLLKRFFYKPVLAVLDARRQGMRDQALRAEATQKEAEALKTQYEDRLHSWQQEQAQSRQTLEQELAQEHLRRLEALKKTLADEGAKEEARAKARTAQHEARLVRQASGAAYAAAAAMLKRLAGPELTARIVGAVIEDLSALPEQQRAALHEAAGALGSGPGAEICAAHPLDEATLQSLLHALGAAAGQTVHGRVMVKPELIAGVRIAFGERLLQANLAEELAFFREGAGGHG